MILYRVNILMDTVPVKHRKRITGLLQRAMTEWNTAMKHLAWFGLDDMLPHAQVEFGSVNRTKQANRVAECRRLGAFLWRIVLAADVKWDDSKWFEFWRGGDEKLIAAITHELGHVLLGGWHSDIAGDVMNPDLLNHLIACDEAGRYRRRFREASK